MKRLNSTDWTDGVDIYVGSPKEGFTLKEKPESEAVEETVVDSGSITVFPVKPEEE